MSRVVDVHGHFYPPAYLDAVETVLQRDATPAGRDMARVVAWARSDRRMWAADLRLEDLDRMRIDLQVLSLSIPNVYFPDRETATALCRLANDAFLNLAHAHPERFRVFAALPLHFPDAAMEELDRLRGDRWVVGVALGANIGGVPLDRPEFEPVYDELERRRWPIFVHPMRPPGIEAMADYHLAPTAGYLFDSTLAALRLVFSGVFERHPGLDLVLPHLGAVLPYMLGRVQHSYEEFEDCRAAISAPPEAYIRRFYFDTICNYPPALRYALGLFGPDHLVYGTDYPFWTQADRIRADVEGLGLTPAERDGILGGNVARLLGLDAAPEPKARGSGASEQGS